MVWGYERSWMREIEDGFDLKTLEACMKFSNRKGPTSH